MKDRENIDATVFPEDLDKARDLLRQMMLARTKTGTIEELAKKPRLHKLHDMFGINQEDLDDYLHEQIIRNNLKK